MLVLRQTFQYNPWRLLQIGNHLQVEVTRLQDSPVNGSQLDYDLLVNAQGPALVAKQQATVLNLGGKEKELSASGTNLSSGFWTGELTLLLYSPATAIA